MLGAWVAYPIVLLVLACGAGAVVQLAAGRPLPSAVRVPCGLALVIAVMDLMTRSTATATLAVPAVVVLAVAGWALSIGLRWRAVGGDRRVLAGALRPGPGAIAALVVFAAYAAPVVLSGQATWLGYNELNDTSIWLALVDQALAHGRTISDLNPSTYSVVLSGYLITGYPLGSFLPLGLGPALVGQDTAWLIDPWMAFAASMLALALHGLARRALPAIAPGLAAVVAALAALSNLLYGYYLWGGLKEVVGAMLVATAALAATLPLEGERRVRAAVPLLVVVWALVAALSAGGLIWIGPGGLVAVGLYALGRRGLLGAAAPVAAIGGGGSGPAGPRGPSAPVAATPPAKEKAKAKGGPPPSARKRQATRPARGRPPTQPDAAQAERRPSWSAGERLAHLARALSPAQRAVAAGVVVVLAGLFLLLRHGGFVETFHSVLTSGSALGVLVKPLNPLQAAGIWPTGDFRHRPSQLAVTYVLIAAVIVSAAVAFVLELRAARWGVVLYVLFALLGAALAVLFASPWIAGKALASASPALPFAALLAGAILARRRAVAGATLIALVGAGILWGDLLGYHDARLAPRALYSSLASIAPSIAGQGPTLMTEYSVYGTRHFLRAADPEDPGDQRSRADPLVNQRLPPATASVDLDDVALGSSVQYPTIVLQRSPVGTRPAEPYALIRSNGYWQVWQRPLLIALQLRGYLPIGDTTSPTTPAGVPVCSRVLALSKVPGVSELVAAPAINPLVVNASAGSHPAHWAEGSLLAMHGSGTARIPVSVPTTGRYGIWLGRTIQNPTSLSIDGRTVATVSDQAEEANQYVFFGNATLAAGAHVVTVHHSSDPLAPGSGLTDLVGPLVLAPAGPAPALITVAASAASTLCGRSLSWVDALGP